YWWLASYPGTESRRRFGTAQWGTTTTVGTGMLNTLSAATGIGTVTVVNTDTTNGRYINLPTLGVSGNRAGHRYNASGLINRAQNVKIRSRFMLPAAGDHTLARFYLGFSTNAELTGDAP